MFEHLFLASGYSTALVVIVWLLGVALIVVAIISIFVQRREGQELLVELEQLEKLKKQNVEYEFVSKAMRLSTWHINPKTMTVTYDYDFREKDKDFLPLTNGTTINDTDELISAEDAERVKKSLSDLCMGRKQDYHEQYRVRIPRTSRYYWEESFATVAHHDAEGNPESIVGTSMRIDERKRMEEALVAARNRAEESDRLKSAFVANMSHEIRTPLNAIIGFTSLLPDITGDEERRELINLIQENNQKLLQIIDDVMNISKIEAGNDVLQMMSFDVNLTLSEVADRFSAKLSPAVKMEMNLGEPHIVTSDMGHISEIMNHLLSNAVKFTAQGTITVKCEKLNNERLRISVQDTGKGIPEDALERIFERFFKIDEFIPGAGLGLSTCRAMALSIGGTIGVESTLGKGSTFWLDIPIK
jgi:signal transduction histidine kinase